MKLALIFALFTIVALTVVNAGEIAEAKELQHQIKKILKKVEDGHHVEPKELQTLLNKALEKVEKYRNKRDNEMMRRGFIDSIVAGLHKIGDVLNIFTGNDKDVTKGPMTKAPGAGREPVASDK